MTELSPSNVPAVVVRGNAAQLLLPDASVDLIVTSPPFWSMRSYQDSGQHIDGQVGAEAAPAEYVDNLIACTREWVRVLKPSGSLWVNLGDKYAGSPSGPPGASAGVSETQQDRLIQLGRRRVTHSVPQKSLIGLPWRYAIRCIDELGLILRAELVWSKPNGLPESVRDRVRRSHEQWFHFVRQPRYYSAVDAIREAHSNPQSLTNQRYAGTAATGNPDRNDNGAGMFVVNPLGKLPGSVWTIATQPLRVPAELGIDHFAAFPMEWPRRIILGWSPSGICTVCDEGRRPVVDKVRTNGSRGAVVSAMFQPGERTRTANGKRHEFQTEAPITGEACACTDATAPTKPAVVLDPFGGTGTTALVASVLGRQGISVDLSADYCRLAVWRINDPKQRARAALSKGTTSTHTPTPKGAQSA